MNACLAALQHRLRSTYCPIEQTQSLVHCTAAGSIQLLQCLAITMILSIDPFWKKTRYDCKYTSLLLVRPNS